MSDSGHALRIQLLGEFCVWVGPRRIDDAEWRLRKAKSLVKLLALAPGHRLHREQVMDALWPDFDADGATNNLHKTLHVARRALEPDLAPSRPSSYLHLEGDLVVLRSSGSLEIDAESFESAIDAARTSKDASAYEAALALYGGDLLPEDRYEDWAAGRREELAAELLDALVALAQLDERKGNIEEAIAALRRVVVREPVHEPAHRSLMRLHALAGQRHHAMREYQQLREVLRREVDAEPEEDTELLYREIRTGTLRPSERAEADAVSGWIPAKRTEVLPEPLFGRDDEMELLEDLLDGLFSGHGQLVLLAGEAGVGKSRLQREIGNRVRRRGGMDLMGAGYEQEGRLPYGPFVEAFETLTERVPLETLRPMIGEGAAEVAHLVLGLGIAPIAPTPSTAQDRRRLFAAVAGFLGSLSERAPLLLALDDLHAADEVSLQLLHYVARNLSSRPILILAAYRSEEAVHGAPLGQLLAALDREGLAEHMQLDRIGRQESDLLIDSLLGGEPIERDVYQAVFELAAGNPLFTKEAIRSLREADVLELSGGRWKLRGSALALPGTVVSLISTRIERLGSAERAVLNVAAVNGREVPYALLRAVGDVPEGQLLDALDVCLERRVIEETSGGYRFSHPLQRAALYERLSNARRTYLHGRVAAALEQLHSEQIDAHAEALAHHYLNSESPGYAAPHLIAAGNRAAAVHANESAIQAFRQALDLLGDPGAPSRTPAMVAELWERIGDLYGLVGEQEHDVGAYESALAALEASDEGSTGARLHRKAAYARLAQHLPEAAERHLVQAFSLLADHPEEGERGRVLRVQAHLHWEQGAYADGVKAAEEALALAERRGDVADTISAYTTLALVFHSHGDWQRGLHFVVEHLGIQADDPGLAELFDAHL
ncbi:MAG: AAA family ATPase [Chloroflexi bacterium]|nr:AAA family ATPase [Chloroflexota bacterium]